MHKHIHILGICGTFMGGLAALAREAGFRVTGCDANVYPPMSDQLASLGIDLVEGYDAAQLGLSPDQWIIGNVVKRGNPLMEAILEQGLRYASGPQWLSDNILYAKWVLAVAGTHGKTTTASILSWILETCGQAPGFLIGGVPINFGVSARLGKTDRFVIEADEYDTAFFDKRSKFVHYRARIAILNNLEFDHADIFADLADIERQFHHFVRILPRNGKIIANADEAALKRVLARECWTPLEWFGTPEGWSITQAPGDPDVGVSFQGKPLGNVRWQHGGAHNASNAIAAIAAATHSGIPAAQAIDALTSFAGVRRRMEIAGTVRNVTVYDDFAHHPTAIEATVAGLRQRVGAARIIAVLEPRSNTMKLGVMRQNLPQSVSAADIVYVYDAGLEWDAQTLFAELGPRARCASSLDSMIESIANEALAGDHILLMSNGGFGGARDRLLRHLALGA